MVSKYNVDSISGMVAAPLGKSRLTGKIQPGHAGFFQGWSPEFAEDRRTPLTYRFGPTIHEPGIEERWQGYESSYLDNPRLGGFWLAELDDVLVEPTNLSIIKNHTLVRETIRSAAVLKNILKDVSAEDSLSAMRSPAVELSSDFDDSPTRSVEEAYLLGFGMYRNYFNWTIRYAARVKFFESLPEHIKLITPTLDIRYIRSTLEFFGVSPDRIVPAEGVVHVEKLHVGSPLALGRYDLSPQMLLNLQKNPRVTGLARTGPRKIYVPRYDVKMRRVCNEADVIETMVGLGFEVFDNAGHSVEEQIQAFRSADVIVSPHGAGLSNIVYSEPGTVVIEIIPQGYDQGVTSYRSLSDLFRLNYNHLFAKEVTVDVKGNRCNSDIEIDIPELVDCLKTVSQ